MYQQFHSQIANLPRVWKRVLLIAFDCVVLTFSLWASYALRINTFDFPNSWLGVAVLAAGPVIAIPIFIRMGLYRAVIRYLPERAIWTILQAMAIAALGWVAIVFLLELSGRVQIPRSVPLIYWALGSLFVGGSRFIVKKMLWSTRTARTEHPVLIYGAGEAGAHLAMSLRQHGRQSVIGFVDDDKALHGRDVAGIRVFPSASLPELIGQYGVKEVILSIPSLAASRYQQIVASVASHAVKIRTLPPIADLVQGKYLISQVREIDIDELLGRSSVPPDEDLLRRMVEGRTIMVTGAGGSIGSELCRLIVRWAPQRLVLFEANEFALYQIERELTAVKERAVVAVLGSVIDEARVRQAIVQYGVQVVFHAAAHKHVPMVEANALEGIRNNVLGTRTVADLAFENGVENFVLISTDKAVRPTNVMGATKRWAELIISEKAVAAAQQGRRQLFSAVRFGNVLGSNGSVVPLFKEQIAHGGPVTLTDPEMTRYFMSIHEAAELIVQAGALSQGGDIFLLDMGEPVAIKDLAENMINLAGFTVRDKDRPNGDIEVIVTGKRPGEKMFEEMFYDESNARATRHPKIMSAPQADADTKDIVRALEQLTDALNAQDEQKARRILFALLNEVAPLDQATGQQEAAALN